MKNNKVSSVTKLTRFEEKEPIKLINIIYIFFICAILGWLVEVGYVFLINGKLVNRGMSYGPYCSIYGFGSIILYLIFHNVKRSRKNIPYVFFLTSITMGTFELLCGLGFKYILGIEMWSYEGQFLEIMHYTTVPILIGWGILGTFFTFLILPLLLNIISLIPEKIIKSIATIAIIVYLIDSVFSTFNIYSNPEILYKLVNPNL